MKSLLILNLKPDAMFRIIALVTILMFGGFSVLAQQRQVFENAVDFCACKFAYSYCNQFATSHPGSLEAISFNGFKSNLDCRIGSTISLDELSTILDSNNFKTFAASNLPRFEAIKEKFNYAEFSDNTDAAHALVDSIYTDPSLIRIIDKFSDVKSLKASLKSSVSDFFDTRYLIQEQPHTTTQAESTTELEMAKLQSKTNTVQGNSRPKPFIDWITIIISVFYSSILFLFLVWKINELSDRSKRHREDIKSRPNSNQQFTRTGNNKDYGALKKKVDQLASEIENINGEIRRLTETLHKQSIPLPMLDPPMQKHSILPKKQVFYAAIPNTDGSFNVNDVTSEKNNSESLYKFTVSTDDPGRASFEFLNESRAIKEAINSPQLILYPVCNINNTLNPEAISIRTTNPGVVVKHNDRWERDKSAEIVYE